MSLTQQRRAIYHLLDETNPADAMAAYFAFYHPDNRTILRPYPYTAIRAEGYVSLSRTGMDLFRPFVTLRLPSHNMQTSTDVIYEAIDAGTAVILNSPTRYAPLLHALFEVQSEEHLSLYVLRPSNFQPIINVLVTQHKAPNGLPRFPIRDRENDVIGASPTLNWQSPTYAEIGVATTHGADGINNAAVVHLIDDRRILCVSPPCLPRIPFCLWMVTAYFTPGRSWASPDRGQQAACGSCRFAETPSPLSRHEGRTGRGGL